MSRETIMWTEDGEAYSFDNTKTQGWLNGHASGAEDVAKHLEAKAIEAFARRDDAAALKLRSVADEIRKDVIPKMKTHAEQHAKQHPMRVEERDRSAHGSPEAGRT